MEKIKQVILIIIGTLFVGIGLIGLLVPVMPTLPFLIIAGICYINSSKKYYDRLIRTKYFGKHIARYVERREISHPFKIYGILLLWIPTIITTLFIVKEWHWYYKILPFILVLLVSCHIITLKTVYDEKEPPVKLP